jgi:hypothetical protein
LGDNNWAPSVLYGALSNTAAGNSASEVDAGRIMQYLGWET